jgi:amino acid adenylation domain-containing protein
MERALAELVDALENEPSRALASIDVLPESEREQLLVEWNATQSAAAADVCVHELVEAQAARIPDAAAVEFEGERLSYAELNARANRLARHLRTLGVGPDVRVGVCMERSLELVVGLLSVLKAGGAYVPLDPNYPRERLSFVVNDSAPVMVLTHGCVSDGVRATLVASGLPTLDVVDDVERWSHQSSENLDRGGVSPERLAYLIYTSGSTGAPKGAMVEHRSLANVIAWSQDRWNLDESDALLQKTPFSFDVSAWEFFWPLASGARLVMARPGGHRDPAYLVQAVRETGITTLKLVPSQLSLFLEHADAEACASLRHLISGGEALPAELLRRARTRLPETQITNVYGPTEATVDVTWWKCPETDLPQSIPIGRPMANTRMYILDERLEPVPVGVSGELYIGGVQVARGYLNRPELTAQRFIASPFVAGDRLYKTGDLARYRPDGNIEYLGRNDFQVKLRGFRIELGEIESRLAEHAEVREAVVVSLEDGSGEKRLVAYYTSADGEIGAEALRTHLQTTLPEYMVPAAYVLLESLPLTAHGKLDRKALPAPDGGAYASRAYEAPEGEIELTLAAIWRDLLGVDRVGRNDNLFVGTAAPGRLVCRCGRVLYVSHAQRACRRTAYGKFAGGRSAQRHPGGWYGDDRAGDVAAGEADGSGDRWYRCRGSRWCR